MNLFGLDIEHLDMAEARKALSGSRMERLPGAPPFLSIKECAAILGVSVKIVDYLIESGQLPLVDTPDDSPASSDLFGALVEPPREICILRADLAALFERLLLCNKPVLDPENS
jgi:hypothetical protein